MTHTLLVRTLVLSLLLCLSSSWPAYGGPDNLQKPAEKNLNIVAVGAFLGQLDGFCEYPGGSYDLDWFKGTSAEPCPQANGQPGKEGGRKALGGLLGARSWLRTQPGNAKPPVLIVAGNNQPGNFAEIETQDQVAISLPSAISPNSQTRAQMRAQQVQTKLASFWSELASLNPAAVGMGPEDFLRSLRLKANDERGGAAGRPVDRAVLFRRWIESVTNQGQGLPLIASNVIVRTRNRYLGDLNQISSGDFSLGNVDKDSSIAWLDKITVNHPASAGLVFKLCDKAKPQKCPTYQPKKATDTATELQIEDGSLLPGRSYDVVVNDQIESPHTRTLTFQTHAALTPREKNLSHLNGFPVVTHTVGGVDLLIVSLLDPDVNAMLGKQARTWKGDGCTADECEIEVVSPADTMKILLERVIAAKQRKPFVVLISALSDERTMELLDTYPEIRVVVLPPDSQLLGRASRPYTGSDTDLISKTFSARETKQRYSGDQGLTSVVNGAQAQATVLVARPEWVGETAARLSAAVRFEGGEWWVDDGEATMAPVGGAALKWDIAKCPYSAAAVDCVTYHMTWEDQAYSYGPYEQYVNCAQGSREDKCDLLRAVATSEEQFRTFAGDALRRAINAELAFVPDDLLDYDVGSWLNDLLKVVDDRPDEKPSMQFLSRLILERGLYRSFRYVRASIAGDKLVDTLDKILKSAVVGGSGCLTGVQGKTCATAVNTRKPETITVNGRPVDSRLYYSIAVPDNVAESLGLTHQDSERGARDAMEILHAQLANGSWYVADRQETLAERLLDRGRRRVRTNLITSSLEVGFTQGLLPSLDGREGTLKGLDVEFRSVTASKNLIGKGAVDFAILDTTRFAVRAIGNLDFNRKTDTIKRTRDVTYSSNSWLLGGRVDVYKWQARNREFRPYVGLFREGEVEREPQFFTATFSDTNGGLRTTTSASAPTAFDQPPLQFNYTAAGMDIINAFKLRPLPWAPVDITRLTVQYADGTLHNVPGGIRINDTLQGDAVYDLYLTGGAGAVLNDYFNKNRTTFDPNVQFGAHPGHSPQRRLQLEADLEPRLTHGSRVYKFGTDIRYRRYVDLPETARLNLEQSWRLRFRLTIPLYWRFELVPNYEYHRATIKTMNPLLDETFRYKKFEAALRLPFVARAGWGGLFQ